MNSKPMTYDEFLAKWNGKLCDFDGYYGYQCMDLAHQFAVEVNGQDIPAAPAAKDVWTKESPGYEKFENTPEAVPEKGDIIIWGVEVGPYGHIAVFDHGDVNGFVSFDQNWPINSSCHLQNHNYKGVLGWLRPHVVATPPPASEPIQPTNTITQEQAIRDAYQGLTGMQPSEGELNYRLVENRPLRELIDSICSGDQRFKDKWVVCPEPAKLDDETKGALRRFFGFLGLG